MNFEDFSKQFGTKEDFVRSIPEEEQPAFQRAATTLQKTGFDWYIANDDLCFGVKPVKSSKAAPRAGRLWKTYQVAINLGRKQSSAMTAAMQERLKSAGGTVAPSGTRIYFSIPKFDDLISDGAFLRDFAEVCGVENAFGLWPNAQYEQFDDNDNDDDDDDADSDGDGDAAPIPPDVEKKALVQVRQRQTRFKEDLIAAWGSRCAISGCEVGSVLEAAHITPYSELRDYSMWNGLLLRSDIHKLFDSYLLSVDERGVIHVASCVEDELYTALQDTKVTFPTKEWCRKLKGTLAARHDEYLKQRRLK